MTRTFCSALTLALVFGCSPPSTTTAPATDEPPAVTFLPNSPDAKVVELFSKFQKLPDNEKDTLKGDKIINQIEMLMGEVSDRTLYMVQGTVKIHNDKMVARAMKDTSADPEPVVSGTEFPGMPRERKE